MRLNFSRKPVVCLQYPNMVLRVFLFIEVDTYTNQEHFHKFYVALNETVLCVPSIDGAGDNAIINDTLFMRHYS